MKLKNTEKERCDHCKKWISTKHQTHRLILEGLVSENIDFNLCICGSCIDKHTSIEYWDAWVIKKVTKNKNNVKNKNDET